MKFSSNLTDKLKGAIKNTFFSPFLAETDAIVKHPLLQANLWRDYIKTLRSNKFIRSAKLPADNGKIALIGSLSEFIMQNKQEAMLGLGLRMEGWRVVALVRRHHFWPRRYFKAYGINDFLFYEDIPLRPDQAKQCAEDVKNFLTSSISFREVKNWSYRGVWIGPHVLSSVVRNLHSGAPDLTDPAVQANMRQTLPQILEIVHRVENLLKKIKPDLVFLNEANGGVFGALTDVMIKNGTDVIQFVQPARDDGLIYKRLNSVTRRIHANSISKESLDRICQMEWGESEEQRLQQEILNRYNGKWFLQGRNQPGVQHKNRAEIIQQLKLDPAKKIAVMFSHILWDANLFFGEDLFEDYGDWFVQTVRAACNNDKVSWLVKMHPANLFKRALDNYTGGFAEVDLIRKHIGDLPSHVKLLYPDFNISSLSLFKGTDYGITVRGTIGIELPTFGIPVLTAGTGRYSGLGFTVDSDTKEEYLNKLSSIQQIERLNAEPTLLAKKHAFAVFCLRPWIMKSFKTSYIHRKIGRHPLDYNLTTMVSSLEDIRNNGDLQSWAKWAGNSDEVDYLNSNWRSHERKDKAAATDSVLFQPKCQ